MTECGFGTTHRPRPWDARRHCAPLRPLPPRPSAAPGVCRELHQSLALKNLVIDAFIPQEEVQKVGEGIAA